MSLGIRIARYIGRSSPTHLQRTPIVSIYSKSKIRFHTACSTIALYPRLSARTHIPISIRMLNTAIEVTTNNNGVVSVEQNISISTTPKEEKLFSLLVSTADYIKEVYGTNVVLRIAGGWVRDKILGEESDDIDVTIDTMTGEEYATYMKEYAAKFSETSLRTIATVKVNPEKSKHLATATTIIDGLSIDLVNLRSEEYSSSSRTPSVEFGTPEQDAFRRDITINALFYNIHTRKVEDFTRSGVQDLRDGVIRTPLDPIVTFNDDPLRILRILRFATRFKYSIVPEIIKAFEVESLKDSLRTKVSRERVGIEIMKILQNGKEPARALQYLYDYDFFPSVFVSERCSSPKNWKPAILVVNLIRLLGGANRAEFRNYSELDTIFNDKRQIALLYLASVIVPYAVNKDNRLSDEALGETGRLLMTDALKLGNLTSSLVESLYCNMSVITACCEGAQNSVPTREDIGELVSLMGKRLLRDDWRLAILNCAIVDYVARIPDVGVVSHLDLDNFLDHYKNYHTICEYSSRYGLNSAFALKPILNGREVATALGCSPGPEIGKHLNDLLRWQFGHQNASKSDAVQFLKSRPK